MLGLTVAGTLALCKAIGTAVLFATVGMSLACGWMFKASMRERGVARFVGFWIMGMLGSSALAVSGVLSYVVSLLHN